MPAQLRRNSLLGDHKGRPYDWTLSGQRRRNSKLAAIFEFSNFGPGLLLNDN